MIYLDTHIVVWLYAGRLDTFINTIQTLLQDEDLLVFPIVRLALQYLSNPKRVTVDADTVLSDLQKRIGLAVCEKPVNTIIANALSLDWTRDPFERILVAHTSVDADKLITKDLKIREHYAHVAWG